MDSSDTTNTKSNNKKIIVAVLIVAVIIIIIAVVSKNNKSFTVTNEDVVDPTTSNEDAVDPTTSNEDVVDPITSNEDVVDPQITTENVKNMNIHDISNMYILKNYKKPMLTNKETNLIEHGNFVVLQESSDVLERIQLNVVTTSMYFPNLHIYVVRGIYGESIVNCFVDAKTLEFVRVNSDYTGDSVLQSSGKKQKPNEPLQQVLKYNDAKKYFPPQLQQMISERAESFLQRTTMNTNGVDSKRLY